MQYFNEIQRTVCNGEVILSDALQGKTHLREVVFCRQSIMFFLKEYNPKASFNEIADKFGQDHATAIHSIKTIKNLICTDKVIAEKISNYRIRIDTLLNFEKNIVVDKLEETKTILRLKIDSNSPITYENMIVYNKLIEIDKKTNP
jgi:Bacterial dnaA protein helix-turn-helix